MWLDRVLLFITLIIALVGTTTNVSDSAIGKVVLSGLLIASTALTLLLKREEARKAQAQQRRIHLLVESSLPSDEFVEIVKETVLRIRRRQSSEPHIATALRAGDDLYAIWSFYDDPQDGDSLSGLLVLDQSDLRKLAVLDDRALEGAMSGLLSGAWGNDDLAADAALISARIIKTMAGWLLKLDNRKVDLATYSTLVNYAPGRVLESVRLIPVNRAGREFDNLQLLVEQQDIRDLLALPVLERGARIADLVDRWLIWL